MAELILRERNCLLCMNNLGEEGTPEHTPYTCHEARAMLIFNVEEPPQSFFQFFGVIEGGEDSSKCPFW